MNKRQWKKLNTIKTVSVIPGKNGIYPLTVHYKKFWKIKELRKNNLINTFQKSLLLAKIFTDFNIDYGCTKYLIKSNNCSKFLGLNADRIIIDEFY